MLTSRRTFLRTSGAVLLGLTGLRNYLEASTSSAGLQAEGYGALVPDPNKIFDLPKGFSYRVISRAGETMVDGFLVPGMFDGTAGKTILIRNHELTPDTKAIGPFGPNNTLFPRVQRELLYDAGSGQLPGLGGTTTLVYDTRTAKLDHQFLSLAGTHRNCAGGLTPWNTWITCEESVAPKGGPIEKDHGYNFEVPATATPKLHPAIPLKEMGRFNHEAVAVDPKSGIVYQTGTGPMA
jgi:uncharacterized protein